MTAQSGYIYKHHTHFKLRISLRASSHPRCMEPDFSANLRILAPQSLVNFKGYYFYLRVTAIRGSREITRCSQD